jgi:hypothetical protein
MTPAVGRDPSVPARGVSGPDFQVDPPSREKSGELSPFTGMPKARQSSADVHARGLVAISSGVACMRKLPPALFVVSKRVAAPSRGPSRTTHRDRVGQASEAASEPGIRRAVVQCNPASDVDVR